MGALLANGIWTADSADPVDLHVTAGIVAAAASDAIGGDGKGARKPMMFTAASQTEKNLISSLQVGGVVAGDQVFMSDTQWTETFGSFGWQMTQMISSIAYTPSAAALSSCGIYIGDGSTNISYFVSGSTVTVSGAISLGTTGTMDTSMNCGLPLPLAPYIGTPVILSTIQGSTSNVIISSNTFIAGTVIGLQASGAMGTMGPIIGTDTGGSLVMTMYSRYPDQSTADKGKLLGYGGNIPRSWATSTANRKFSFIYSYTKA